MKTKISKNEETLLIIATIKDAEKNHQSAFSRLVSLYTGLVKTKVREYFKNDNDMVDEVFNLVFHKVYNKIGLFNEQKGNFESWLVTLTKNFCLDLLKGRSRDFNKVSISYDIPEENLEFVDEEEYQIQLDLVMNAIGALSERNQLIVKLRFFEGNSYAEIAEKLNLTKVNVGVELNRSMSKIKALAMAV